MAVSRSKTFERPQRTRPKHRRVPALPAYALIWWTCAVLSTSAGFGGLDDGSSSLLPQRHRQIEQMSPAEKELLLSRQKQFAELPPAEQERLRKLHGELQKRPDCQTLQGVLARYHQWFSQLSPLQRTELLAMTPEARVAKIQELRAKEEAERRKREEYQLSPQDLDAIVAWLDGEMKAKLAAAPGAQYLQLTPDQRRGALYLLFRQGTQGGPMRRPELSIDDLASLRERLSPEAQKKLDSRQSPEQKRDLLMGWNGWVWLALRESQRRYFDNLLAEDKDDLEQKLVQMFESLPIEDRSLLMEQSSESRQQTLKILYLQKHMSHKLAPPLRQMDAMSALRGRGGFRGDGRPDFPPRRDSRSGDRPSATTPAPSNSKR